MPGSDPRHRGRDGHMSTAGPGPDLNPGLALLPLDPFPVPAPAPLLPPTPMALSPPLAPSPTDFPI